MIGRTEPLQGFATIRWAREMAVEHKLSLVEAHVLLLLATYSDENGVAYPSIETLTERSGLKVSYRKPTDKRPRPTPRNSTISAALQRLEDLQLIWSKQGGRRTTTRELLFNPTQPSATQDGEALSPSARPDGDLVVPPSAVADPAVRMAGHELPEELPGENNQTENCQITPSVRPDGVTVREGGPQQGDIDIARERRAIDECQDPALKARLEQHFDELVAATGDPVAELERLAAKFGGDEDDVVDSPLDLRDYRIVTV